MLEIVKRKLQAVDSECESSARAIIEKHYESAKYNGTRFVIPSFQEVGAVWLKLLKMKESRSLEALSNVLSHPNSEINSNSRVEIEILIEELFAESRYVDRLSIFFEGVGRKSMSYGVRFDPSVYRFDLHDSGYRTSVKNGLRKARRGLKAEILLHSQPSTPDAIRWLKSWLSFTQSKPWQSLAFVLTLTFLALLSSLDLQEILGWIMESPTL